MLISRDTDGPFLLRLFVAALLARMIIGLAIFAFHGQDFFGGDAITYDFFGIRPTAGMGRRQILPGSIANQFVRSGEGSGWGMVYLVAAVYGIVGRNMLAVQLMNSVFGAATAVIIYLVCPSGFQKFKSGADRRHSRGVLSVAGALVGAGTQRRPIVFLLALAILCTLKLGEKLSAKIHRGSGSRAVGSDSFAVLCFLHDLVAIGGAFVIGMQQVTATSFARQFTAIILLGLALTYVGVTRSARRSI